VCLKYWCIFLSNVTHGNHKPPIVMLWPINNGTLFLINQPQTHIVVISYILVKMKSLSLIATALCCVVVVFGGLPFSSNAQLSHDFYAKTCPQLQSIVYQVLDKVSRIDSRMPASIIRLHFHDCFVQVCIIYSFICIYDNEK